MSNHFTIVTTRAGCAVVHTPSHKEVLPGLTPEAAKAALEEIVKYDGNCKPTDSRLGTWRGACRRAIARMEVSHD